MFLGWRFATPEEKLPGDNVTPDPIHGCTHLRDVYFKVSPDYEGRFTVPTLYDVKQGKIVSNEVCHHVHPIRTSRAFSCGPELQDCEYIDC